MIRLVGKVRQGQLWDINSTAKLGTAIYLRWRLFLILFSTIGDVVTLWSWCDVHDRHQYREMYERSIKDPAGFWSEIAETFYWKEKWNPTEVCSENLDVTKGPVQINVSAVWWLLSKLRIPLEWNGYNIVVLIHLMVLGPVQWFKGGKTNICYNAVDRNIESGDGDKIAMYWEGNEPGQDGKLTYSELLEKVCQVNACSCLKCLTKVKPRMANVLLAHMSTLAFRGSKKMTKSKPSFYVCSLQITWRALVSARVMLLLSTYRCCWSFPLPCLLVPALVLFTR